jgi:hypothetical protein
MFMVFDSKLRINLAIEYCLAEFFSGYCDWKAEQMYTALRRRNIDATLVRYPREGHGLHEPQHRVDQITRSVAWFDKYLQH